MVNSDAILTSGIQLYKRKAYTDALTLFLGITPESAEDNMELAYYLGLCYAKLERYDDALLYLEQVVTSGEEIERVLQCRFLLAIIYALSGRRRLADFELNKLLETGYKTSSVYAAIAFIAWEQNDIDKCVVFYEKSLEVDPNNLTSLNGLGYVLACEKRDLTKALTCAKKAVDASPKSAACLDSLGWVYYNMGLVKEAQTYLERAVRHDKTNPLIKSHLEEVMKTGASI